MKRLSLIAVGAISLSLVLLPGAKGEWPVKKEQIDLRGKTQSVHFLPGAQPEAANRPAVLFLPGDRGWAGKAIEMGETIASWGFDVYGVDTNVYLTSFTDRTAILTERQIMDDVLAIADRLSPKRPVLLVGWSEGAGLAALAASSQASRSRYAGVVVFGLADENVLAWRWKDELAILAQTVANEPTFSVKERLADISPIPFVLLRSTGDQFVSEQEARDLFDAARDPKRYIEVEAKNHRFDGNDAGFFHALQGAIEWALEQNR